MLHIKRLIEFLAVNNSQKIRYEEISKILGISQIEARHYLELLKETYIIHTLRPFYTNS